MKQQFFTFMLLLSFICLEAQQIRLDSIAPLKSDNSYLSKPKWSPDGKFILATGESNTGLYLVSSESAKTTRLSDEKGAGVHAFWIGNAAVGFTSKNEIKNIGLPGMKSTQPSDTIAVLNPREKSVEMVDLNTGQRKAVTPVKAFYYNPILSPDKSMVVVHLRSEMLVFRTDGSGEVVNLGPGMASSWTPDGKSILYFVDKSKDGHSISNSDLYLIDISGKNRQQLTFTDDMNEMWADVSSDGNKLVFTDSKTGILYTAKILKP